MDTKIEIKEEDPLSSDVAIQNETEFFTNNVAMKTKNNAVLVDNCDRAIKMEIKSEPPFPDFCSQKRREFLTKNGFVKQIKYETVTCSNNCQMNNETEIEDALVSDLSSQNRREVFKEDPVREVKKCNSDHEKSNKIEVKEENWCLEMETSSIYDIKEEDFPSVKSSRSSIETVSDDSPGRSPSPCNEDLRKGEQLCAGKGSSECGHSKSPEGYVQEKHSVEKNIHSEQSSKCNGVGNTYSKSSNLKQKNFIHEGKRSHRCEICEKRFPYLSLLKVHSLIHKGQKPHKCEICGKRFNQFQNLKRHLLIHDGKKLYQCEICEKRFTQLSSLKRHSLIHEGRKPYECEICEKRFTDLSNLKSHNLIHEDKKPYKCPICEKRFIHLSYLKRHHLRHKDKKIHKCEVCEKTFTQLSGLKTHTLIHEGKKPHKCEICEKRFTQLSNLKRHSLVHKDK